MNLAEKLKDRENMKVKVITLGCKVNIYESEYIISLFKKNNYEITNGISDIYIVNTCSVTNTSDAKSRKVINKIIKENNKAIIVVMGCMIEAHKDYENKDVSIILGNKDKSKVVELVEEYLKNKEHKKILYDDFDKEFEDMYIDRMDTHTRAFVKIQDGCENFCSYCIIPYTRGRQRSKDKDKVIKEITDLVHNGYQEIVLTGIHTGHYGSDLKTTFPELLEQLIRIKGLKRLRISSIEITELDDHFMRVLKKSDVIVSHLHIPLQAGSDTILKLMNRKYITDYFYEKIEAIRSIRPDINITTDVIVGFPGETEELFEETMKFIKKVCFTKVHVFPYSRRSGTVADTMPNQIPDHIKKERVSRLIEVSNKLERDYANKFIGQELDVLIEKNAEHTSNGLSSNYIRVITLEKIDVNKIIKVKISSRTGNSLVGSINKKNKKGLFKLMS